MMNKNNVFFLIIMSFFVLAACSNDDNFNLPDDDGSQQDDDDVGNDDDDISLGAFQTGVLISNEGPFNTGAGSISFIDEDLNSVENNIYETVNGETLGNIVQSIGFDAQDRAYIISNISSRLDIVDRFTFEQIFRIENGLVQPRYFVEANGFGYISNWGDPFDPSDDYIAVLDLTDFSITTTIPVSEGPERLLYNGTNIYVTQRGGFGVNNLVTVIDPTTNEIVTEIDVADRPNKLELDTQGNLWVLAPGIDPFDDTQEETIGRLSRINTTTNMVDQVFNFPLGQHPESLTLDRDIIYYFLDGGIFSGNALDFLLPNEPNFIVASNLFNMEAEGGILYGCNAADFNSNGSIELYDTNTGQLTDSFTVDLVPGNIYFVD